MGRRTSWTSSSGRSCSRRSSPRPTYADGDPNKRWDAARNAALSEIFGFYGLAYWYAEQVTILGLGPIWQSDNASRQGDGPPTQLDAGGVMAFGLSEREHGADIYNDRHAADPADRATTPRPVAFRANGEKYYIGNGNVAGMVSVFSRRTDVEGADGYVWFVADSRHPSTTSCIGNVVHGQMYVSTFALERLPGARGGHPAHRPRGVLGGAEHRQRRQVQPVHGSIGMCEHAFYEAITHATTAFCTATRSPTSRTCAQTSSTPTARLVAMKLFSDRAVDYFRSAEPRRPPVPAVQPDDQVEGHLRGREGDHAAAGRDRRQGLREEHLLPRGRPADRHAAAARGHRARQRRRRS